MGVVFNSCMVARGTGRHLSMTYRPFAAALNNANRPRNKDLRSRVHRDLRREMSRLYQSARIHTLNCARVSYHGHEMRRIDQRGSLHFGTPNIVPFARIIST
jgi:hypothetical protein